ncbi:cytochrome P450 [Xylariaceae sp. FL1651]|nr:cytochrome P450 [Xylariaceae sp. FL1651]
MEVLNQTGSWQQMTATAFVLYCISLVVYRLFFHPLARFPGPKLAAVTLWYEAYYDVVQNGQYTFKIAKLHKQYGPIIRISPRELHVSDPEFFDKIYRQDGKWDKYAWAVDAFVCKGGTLFTSDHALHKARRQPLNPFFSKAKIAGRQDLLQKHLRKLLGQISSFAEQQKAVDLGAAMHAYTRDVANELILEKDCNSLCKPNFDFDATIAPGPIWRVTKHMPWYNRILRSFPIGLVTKIAGEGVKSFYLHLGETVLALQHLMSTSSGSSGEASDNIVRAILASKLPPSEKTFVRVFEDLSTIMGAGIETTASALRLILFHLYSDANMLERLRAELASVDNIDITDTDSIPQLRALEQLPFLTAVLMEGLRLSPAVATRMARVAPDRDIFYNEWRIPAGIPVGMTIILMHMDESIYPEPQQFNPDRWMDPETRKGLEKHFVPFSRGTRNCVGMHLAWAELYLVVSTLIRRFDFRFEGVIAEDLRCSSDQFIIGTKSGGHLRAVGSAR